MSERAYSFEAFIERIKDKDYQEIISAAEAACASVEKGSYGVRGAVKRREMGSTQYAHQLKEFLFFMRCGAKPASVHGEDYRFYRSVCEALVAKGQFKPEVMELFS